MDQVGTIKEGADGGADGSVGRIKDGADGWMERQMDQEGQIKEGADGGANGSRGANGGGVAGLGAGDDGQRTLVRAMMKWKSGGTGCGQ